MTDPRPIYSEHIFADDGQLMLIVFKSAPTTEMYEALSAFADFKRGRLANKANAVQKAEGPPFDDPTPAA